MKTIEIYRESVIFPYPDSDEYELDTEDEMPETFDEDDTLDDVIRVLRNAGAIVPSSSSFHRNIWYSTHAEENFFTGASVTYTFHLKGFTLDEECVIYAALTGREV